MRAGALGFATSRAIVHKSSDGELTPMYRAERDEVLAIAGAIGGRGVVQWVTDFQPFDVEWSLFLDAGRAGGAGATFSLVQGPGAPFGFRKLLAAVDEANAMGHRITPQVLSRPVGVLMGLEATIHPFVTKPSYQAIAHLPLAERVRAMREPALKAKIIAEPAGEFHAILAFFDHSRDKMFPMGASPDYAPPARDSIAARAATAGRDADDWLYDWLLEDGGRALIYIPLYNFATGDLSGVRELMAHPATIFGLADGGAHVGTICDASSTTYMLARWVKETGEMGLGEAVRMMTRAPAEAVGLMDRGGVRVGLKADLNVIDLDNLAIRRPEVVHDLPAGGKRFMQRADGYVATIVAGQAISRDGARTDALPGKLVRGRQSAG